MGEIVLAFDSDEAGEKALENAFLTLLNLVPTERAYVRAVIQDQPYPLRIAYLSNRELFEEYRYNVKVGKLEVMEGWQEGCQEEAEACLALISERSGEVTRLLTGPNATAAERFQAEHTITDVLEQFDIQAVPGRNIRCPIHDDTSPSLTIFEGNYRVYCFNPSCPLNGDGKGERAYMLYRLLAEKQNERAEAPENPGP